MTHKQLFIIMIILQENRLAEDETRMVISESDSQGEHSEENQDLGMIKIVMLIIYGFCDRNSISSSVKWAK